MSFTILKIDNSKDAAVSTGKWSNPGAKFYNQLLNTMYSKDGSIPNDVNEYEGKLKDGTIGQFDTLLKEAYLIAPVNRIKNTSYGVTPFSRSGCKYPHHVIKDGTLVLSVAGVKAAYARAKQQGEFKGALKAHLERHYKELGLYDDSTMNESTDYIPFSADALYNLIERVAKEYGKDLSFHQIDLIVNQLMKCKGVQELIETRSIDDDEYEGLCSMIRKSMNKLFKEGMDITGFEVIHNRPATKNIKRDPDLSRKESVMALIESNFDDIMDTICSHDESIMEIASLDSNSEAALMEYIETMFGTGKSDLEQFTESTDEAYGIPKEELDKIAKDPKTLSTWMKRNIQYDKSIATWRLKSPIEMFQSKKGNCHDQSLFTMYALSMMGYQTGQVFFIEFKEGSSEGGTTHSFTWYKDGKQIFWLENAWESFAGIHGPYKDIYALKWDVFKCFCKDNDINSGKFDGIMFTRSMPYSSRRMRAKVGQSLGEYVENQPFHENHKFYFFNRKEEEIKEAFDWMDQFIHSRYFREKYNSIGELPDHLYFASNQQLDSISGPIFLTPYIGIASIFISNGKKVLKKILEEKFGSNLIGYSANVGYDEWEANDVILTKPLSFVHMNHNIHDLTGVFTGKSSGYIYEIDISDIRNDLVPFTTNDPNREVRYRGTKELKIIRVIPHIIEWSIGYSEENASHSGPGSYKLKENNKDVDLPPMADSYDPPYNKDQVIEKYGEDIYHRLANDPAHLYRMETGIELIHKEPSKEELDRICSNWLAMTPEMKLKSDEMSKKLFNMDNLTHYRALIQEYDSDGINESTFFEDAPPALPSDKQIIDALQDQLNPKEEESSDENEQSTEEPKQEEKLEETPSAEEPAPLEQESIEEEQPPEEDSNEEPSEEQPEEEPPVIEERPQEEKPVSMPKQADAAEEDKNGVRRKKLYIAFIEWAKLFNQKNTFGSIFDKDAFHVTYPFVPHEMRYFYRLANPILCVLPGKLTFFQVSELKKLNSENKQMDQYLIFAATDNDMRVFSIQDKKVYQGLDENGELKLGKLLGDTFDLYLQTMINQGDILNGPIDDESSSKNES